MPSQIRKEGNGASSAQDYEGEDSEGSAKTEEALGGGDCSDDAQRRMPLKRANATSFPPSGADEPVRHLHLASSIVCFLSVSVLGAHIFESQHSAETSSYNGDLGHGIVPDRDGL